MKLTILDKVVVVTCLLIVSLLLQDVFFDNETPRSRAISILSNLHRIASAGQQYILEENSESVSYQQLMKTGYLDEFTPLADESYDSIVISKDGGVARAEADSGSFAYTY